MGHCSWTHWYWCPGRAPNKINQQVTGRWLEVGRHTPCPIWVSLLSLLPWYWPHLGLKLFRELNVYFYSFLEPPKVKTHGPSCSDILKKTLQQNIKIWKILALCLINQNNDSSYSEWSQIKSLLSLGNTVSALSLSIWFLLLNQMKENLNDVNYIEVIKPYMKFEDTY